jgi:hypothetical protein
VGYVLHPVEGCRRFWERCFVEQEASPEAQVQTYDSSSKELPTPLGPSVCPLA